MADKMIQLPKTTSPTERALKEIGIEYLEDLCKYSVDELLALHGVGPKSIRILQEDLKKHNLSFK
jgi:DNA-directed RNA polymerase alpha subunit